MIEVIVFGKGYGESILLHIKRKWFVVDSFLAPQSQVPIAIKYLNDKGYDIEDISGVICTHWDNDHVAGISKIIEQHSDGLALCLPIIYNDTRFAEYVAFNSGSQQDTTSEFLKVLNLIGKKNGKLLYAISDRSLFQREINDPEICLKALSPNDQQYKAFLDSICIPKKGEVKRSILLEENKLSVVTYVKTCLDSILLGGDMENFSNGWESICNSFIDNKCHVFKIPHHGSKNSYNKNVWQTMVERPISIITRFNRWSLPTDDMIKDIAKESSALYVVGPEPKKDKNSISRARKYGNYNAVQSMELLDHDYGYVKLSKFREEQDWLVETFGAVKQYG